MKWLLITVFLGVAMAARNVWTVDEVEDKINGIPDKSQDVFPLPAHLEWPFTYSPESDVTASGTILLNNVKILDINDIRVNGIITQINDNEFEIPLHANYKCEGEYNITIPNLMQNHGRSLVEMNVFSPIIHVKINDAGVFELVDVKSLTMGPVALTFYQSKYSKAHDVIFNKLQSTFRSLVIDEVRKLYGKSISSLILSFVK